jgi:cardiolipin synthase
VLLDAIGSRSFLTGSTAKVMQEAGIHIQEALPSGIIKAFFARIDIRNHRKIVVIDGRIAYTGSQNMVDPYVFRQDAGVGNWIDVMVRVQGPVVESLAGTFINDWFLETDIQNIKLRSLHEDIDRVRKIGDVHRQEPVGRTAVQLVPSGPGFTSDAIHSLLLTTIYAARKELILTTPYFIPDDALLTALKSASLRGVDVTVIIPAKNESRLAEYATRALFDELIQAGVHLKLFQGGFLHSKTITVDGDFALFGSVNLDMRSFWLNFEATLFIYDPDVCMKLLTLQRTYMRSCIDLDLRQFDARSPFERFKEKAVLLIGPLL